MSKRIKLKSHAGRSGAKVIVGEHKGYSANLFKMPCTIIYPDGSRSYCNAAGFAPLYISLIKRHPGLNVKAGIEIKARGW